MTARAQPEIKMVVIPRWVAVIAVKLGATVVTHRG